MPVPDRAECNTNTSTDLGEEIDVVYTHFFTPGNHVAWQIGGGVFLPGERLDNCRRLLGMLPNKPGAIPNSG